MTDLQVCKYGIRTVYVDSTFCLECGLSLWRSWGMPPRTEDSVQHSIDEIRTAVRGLVIAHRDGEPVRLDNANSELSLALAGFADAVRNAAVQEALAEFNRLMVEV